MWITAPSTAGPSEKVKADPVIACWADVIMVCGEITTDAMW